MTARGCTARAGALVASWLALGVAMAAGGEAPAAIPEPEPAVELAPMRTRTSWAWVFIDVTIAGLVRHTASDNSGQLALGLQVETLLGATSYLGRRLPFRLGPFAAITHNGDLDEDEGEVQLSGGLTALVAGKATDGADHGSNALLVSAGVLYDVPEVAADALGYLARVSVGNTTTGRRRWKFFSVWLFAEAHYIPTSDGDRTEFILGARVAPLIFPMALYGSDPG